MSLFLANSTMNYFGSDSACSQVFAANGKKREMCRIESRHLQLVNYVLSDAIWLHCGMFDGPLI